MHRGGANGDMILRQGNEKSLDKLIIFLQWVFWLAREYCIYLKIFHHSGVHYLWVAADSNTSLYEPKCNLDRATGTYHLNFEIGQASQSV